MGAPFTELETALGDYDAVCRGCLVNSGEMKDMFEWGLAEDFCKLTDVVVDQMDDISALLCSNCEETMQKFKDFRMQCFNSNKLLRSLAKKKNSTDDPACSISFHMLPNKLTVMITAASDAKIELVCPYGCTDKFHKQTGLLQHLVKSHQMNEDTFRVDLQYHCLYHNCCYHVDSNQEKWFSGRKYLNQHYNKVHKSKIFHCDICKFKFSTSADYNRHLQSCNKQFTCKICNISYPKNERLLVHLKRRHPDLHMQYKAENKAHKRKAKVETENKKIKTQDAEYMCDSPKRSFATQTLKPEENIRNDVTLVPWNSTSKTDEAMNEISTQTVFEDLLSLKSQNSEEDSIFFSETVSLSDIQTQTFPLEFGLSRSNKETITSETQSPDEMYMSMKETQTCLCLYDSPKTLPYRLFDSVSSSPSSVSLAITDTQTQGKRRGEEDLLNFNTTQTQTCFDGESSKESL